MTLRHRLVRPSPTQLSAAYLGLGLSLVMGGCGAAPAELDQGAFPAQAALRLEAAAAVGPFSNPVLARDFADPGIMRVGHTYYAFATNGGGANVQAEMSNDLVHWHRLPDALPHLPDWADRGRTWAPEALQLHDQAFVLYFTAHHRKHNVECIGAATSTHPAGPYVPVAGSALICLPAEGGVIDPSPFIDADGERYLLYKNDGNAIGHDTWLQIKKLSADGCHLVGTGTRLIKQTLPWEGPLVEAPFLHREGQIYTLFYSAAHYNNASYSVGFATADRLMGPYTKSPEPLLKSSSVHGAVIGPGGQNVVRGPDESLWLTYHSWTPSFSARVLNLTRLSFVDGKPHATATWARPQ